MNNDGNKRVVIVSCPTCRQATRFEPANIHRPFCSAVCKDHDIIAWAEERFRLPERPAADDDVVDSDQVASDASDE